jgi:hypothetical protein
MRLVGFCLLALANSLALRSAADMAHAEGDEHRSRVIRQTQTSAACRQTREGQRTERLAWAWLGGTSTQGPYRGGGAGAAEQARHREVSQSFVPLSAPVVCVSRRFFLACCVRLASPRLASCSLLAVLSQTGRAVATERERRRFPAPLRWPSRRERGEPRNHNGTR